MISDNEQSVVKRAPQRPAAEQLVGGWLSRQPEKVLVRWVVVSCAALALGSLGTWASLQVGGLRVTASGLDSWWGKLTLAAAIVTVVPVVQPAWIAGWAWGARHHLDVSVVASWAALGACVYNLLNSNGDGYAVPGFESSGWGLYLATAASVSLIVWTIVLRRVATRPTQTTAE